MKRLACLMLALMLLCGCAARADAPTNHTPETTTTTTAFTSDSTVSTEQTSQTANTGTTTISPSSGTATESASVTTTTTTTTGATTGTTTASPVVKPEEIQAVWVASIINLDFPSAPGLTADELKRECDAIVGNAKAMGLNTVYFQVRPCGDALYRSSIFPSSYYVVPNQGDPLPVDLLDYMLTACHKAGLKLYAWVNPVRVRREGVDVLHPDNPAVKNPAWVSTCADGSIYYNLGLPEVRTLIADGVAEIVKNYAVDGVVFDDYFYPYPSVAAGFDDSAAFAAYGAGKTLAEFRRASVNQLVRACYNRVKAERSACRFGISPFGIRKNSDAGTTGMEAYSAIYCDAEAWIKGEYVDFIEPQLYWAIGDRSAPFKKLANYWSKAVAGTDVTLRLALGPYRYSEGMYTAGEIAAQVTYGRTLADYAGCSLFRYQFLLNDPSETTTLFK